jgi:chemotaxis protein methyltransferase WspC
MSSIQTLADSGRLDEASGMLETLLSRDGLQGDAWALLGAVRLGQGRHDDAEECFRKVVYLQPQHALSLLQLSALAERRGDRTAADRLRLRAARAAAGEAS